MVFMLGKISSVGLGLFENSNNQLELHIELTGNDWGVSDKKITCDMTKKTLHSKEEQLEQNGKFLTYITSLLTAATVTNIQDLVGTPIEAEFDGSVLNSWRVLTEVL